MFPEGCRMLEPSSQMGDRLMREVDQLWTDAPTIRRQMGIPV
jgi:hypothetical protein